ncbi:MAG: molybdenum cofactor guanylyltransferase [Ktedonobacterales bacterium]
MESSAGQPQPHFTAVVLAGGRSQRMGQDKAALPIGGESLLARMVKRMRQATPHALVIGPPTLMPLLATALPDVALIADDTPNLGPLGGLATALRYLCASFVTPRAFVVACDMPFVAPKLIVAMARLADDSPAAQVVALHTDQGWEPLHAIYSIACLPIIEQHIAAGERSLQRMLDHLSVREMTSEEAARYDPRRLSTFNANAPEDWKRALRLAMTEKGDA